MPAAVPPTLKTLYLRYCHAANSIATSATLIRNIDLPVIESIDAGTLADTYLAQQARTMRSHIGALLRNIGNAQAIQDLYDTYAETKAYLRLKLRHPAIAHVPRQPRQQTPDFALTLPSGRVYLEFKSLNMVGGAAAQAIGLNNSLATNISLQNPAHAGRRLRTATTVLQPYHSPGSTYYSPTSTRMVIETITQKIQGNLSPGQFSRTPTLLLVDLAELPLVSAPEDALKHTYIDPGTRERISGELWHIAWGRLGATIYKPSDPWAPTNRDGALATEGILTAHPYVKGIIFFIDNDWFGAIDRTQQPPHLVKLVRGLTTRTRTTP